MRSLPAVVLAVAASGVLLAGQPPRPAVSRVMNAEDTRKKLGLVPNYAAVPGLKNVRVAVLDSGFAGIDGKRPYLPADAVLVEHYDEAFVRKFDLGDPGFKKPFAPGESHGRLLAQLVWATTGNSPDGPRFFLLNANGPTLFRRAVRYAIEQNVDVILFAGTFEGAGNYDGRGPINAAVDQAVAAGIIWVNAVGNHGGSVYNGPVEPGPTGVLRFNPDKRTGLRLKSRLDEAAATITLTWNDYRDDEDAGTAKDLDLIVEDVRGQVVGESKLVQVPPGKAAGEGQTKNPRERLVLTDLAATVAGGEYRIRVKANTPNFGPRDRIRILVTPGRVPVPDPDTGKLVPAVELLDATRGGEIYPPADHPGVLTVGDPSRSSSVGPTADGREKPDVIVPVSAARFSNGEETDGSSNAAAYLAGVVAVLRATEPGLTTGQIRAWVRSLDRARPAPANPAPVPVAAGPVPPFPGPFPFPPPPLPLSPNQARALRYADYAIDDARKRGDNPLVLLSTPGGEWVVRPGGVLVGQPGAGNGLPAAPAPATGGRADTIHAPWQTPSPRQLADLVRGER